MRDVIETKNSGILKTNRLNVLMTQNVDNTLIFEARLRDTGDFIGHASLGIETKCFGRVGQLTYELSPNFQGQCFATELLRTAIAYIYAELGLVSLYGIAPAKNLAAQYVLQRIGFALQEELDDGTIRFEAWNPSFKTVQEI